MFDFKNNNIEKFNDRIWLSSPTMHGDELKYMAEAYETNWMSSIGKNIDEVQRMVCEKVGCKYSIALSTCTAALHLAVKLAGETVYGKPLAPLGALHQKHVACSELTFAATVNPIVYEGGIPVFVDSEYDTWNIDPQALEKTLELYPDIKILVMVHLFGTPAKMDEILDICRKHDVLIVEDAAESLGSTYRSKYSTGKEILSNRLWRQTGTFGDYNCISFNGNKIITGSAGGMFLTDNEEDAARIHKWSNQARENVAWYQHVDLGYNYRMSNVIAGVVRGQLPYLEEHIAQKKAIYDRYKEGLKGLPLKMNPFDSENSIPNYWLSCVIIDEDALCKQVITDTDIKYSCEKGKTCPTEILEAMDSINAQGRPIWKPMHLQPIYREFPFVTREGEIDKDSYNLNKLGQDGKPLDIGADIFNRGICLPSDNKITEEQQERIIDVIRMCFE